MCVDGVGLRHEESHFVSMCVCGGVDGWMCIEGVFCRRIIGDTWMGRVLSS